jgi:hypothetical protein
LHNKNATHAAAARRIGTGLFRARCQQKHF